jgi:hypothetical protein
MRKMARPAVILGFLLALLGGATAVGDDMVALRISNDDADPVLVTVYDMNAEPPGAVVFRQTISGFAWIPVSVTADAEGTGHVRWTATSAQAGPRLCGHHGDRRLGNDELVRVFADAPCPGGHWSPPGPP